MFILKNADRVLFILALTIIPFGGEAQSSPSTTSDSTRAAIANLDKIRIAVEDLYRLELKKVKEEEQSEVMKFLNSPLGILLLTSIVLGALSYAWKKGGEYLEQKQKAGELVRKGLTEILTQLNVLTDEADKAEDPTAPLPVGNPIETFHMRTDRSKAIFPEFRKRNVSSILEEMMIVSRDEEFYQTMWLVDDLLLQSAACEDKRKSKKELAAFMRGALATNVYDVQQNLLRMAKKYKQVVLFRSKKVQRP